MVNPTNEQRFDRIEQELERMKGLFSAQVHSEVVTLEERFNKKHDSNERSLANTEKALAMLLEGQNY